MPVDTGLVLNDALCCTSLYANQAPIGYGFHGDTVRVKSCGNKSACGTYLEIGYIIAL